MFGNGLDEDADFYTHGYRKENTDGRWFLSGNHKFPDVAISPDPVGLSAFSLIWRVYNYFAED
jgi:hypothetical protein